MAPFTRMHPSITITLCYLSHFFHETLQTCRPYTWQWYNGCAITLFYESSFRRTKFRFSKINNIDAWLFETLKTPSLGPIPICISRASAFQQEQSIIGIIIVIINHAYDLRNTFILTSKYGNTADVADNGHRNVRWKLVEIRKYFYHNFTCSSRRRWLGSDSTTQSNFLRRRSFTCRTTTSFCTRCEVLYLDVLESSCWESVESHVLGTGFF